MIDLLALERMAQDFDQDPCGSGGRKGRGDLRKPSNQCVLGIRQRHGQEKWCFYRNLTFENGLRQEMMPLVGVEVDLSVLVNFRFTLLLLTVNHTGNR